MTLTASEEMQYPRLSALIAERIGLHFPRERWADLRRGLESAADEFGFGDVASCAEWLLTAPLTRAQIQILASHLTIGETYFFRDGQLMQALSATILPELIDSRRGRSQRLRLWSTACCSGEEPYSLAILLHQLLPDLKDWNVTITATDINARFLQKAAAGIYGEWSFRSTPPELRQRYFARTADRRYVLAPEIMKLVTFAHLNLVDDVYPSLETDTNAMDIIVCRNVLMYFTPEQVRKVVRRLRLSLVDGGWLVVSPSEASRSLFSDFASVEFPGAILFQKREHAAAELHIRAAAESADDARLGPLHELVATPAWEPAVRPDRSDTLAFAETLYREGRYYECAGVLTRTFDEHVPAPACSLVARALANQGKLTEALDWVDRWIKADKMNAASHYLRAVVLVEQGRGEHARMSLQRALYLDSRFVLAHFALGNLARSEGKNSVAEKHFANALELLREYRPEELLPESDGLTAGRLAQTITSLSATGVAS